MTTTTARLRRTALAIAAAVVPALAITSGTAIASSHAHAQHASVAHATRSFDHSLLAATNHVRKSHHKHHYTMNHKLWKIAHAYAEHLARTGQLVHNPNLQRKVTRACPAWTDLGENIGYVTGSNPHDLFEAYMHSPEHRANLLGRSYRQVGIASVQVRQGNVVEQWNVMDFANHCH